MSGHQNSKTSLFLMELIIAIMFFSLASAVCVRLFVGAHSLSENDKNLNNAIMWSQNLAEAFYGCTGSLAVLKTIYPDSFFTTEEDDEEGAIVLFFDDDWEKIDNSLSNAAYEALIRIRKESATDAYADVNEYGIALSGNAFVGDIAIIDLRGATDVFTQLPENTDKIIYQINVDTYVKEE